MEALRWRITADRLWTPDVRQALHLSVRGLKGQQQIDAYKARSAAQEIHDVLFPKET